jgi:Phage tail tube protein
MSSSNLVRLAYIAESTYGVTPGSGNFKTARFINEALSGTPDTVESQQIRTDRLSSGQIVTGLQVGGAVGFELAKESALEDFMASALYSDWDTVAAVTVDLTVNATTNEITRASGTWSAIVVGDILTLAGFSNTENNTQVMVAEIVSNTVVRVVPAQTLATETGSGTSYARADKLEVGVTKKSFSICKQFLDLTTKGINYRGMIASEMELNVAFGELVNGSFTFSGNDYVVADQAAELITDGRTINAAATSQTFNGSVDMPFFITSAIGSFDVSNLAVQSLSLSLNNNLSAQTVIGDIAPIDYSAGTAAIGVEMNAYLNDDNWDVLAKKLTQDSFQIGFMVKNNGGWYGFYLPAVQVSFEDPASAGANQDILLNMTGTAKVGSSGEKSLTIYRSV